jgi:hypothetical protein
MNQTSSRSFARRFVSLSVLGLALVCGCSDADVNVNGLGFEQDTANKGETLLVKGKVETLAELTSITFSVRDDKDAPVAESAGIKVSNNTLAKDKISWDLRSEGDVKVVTSASTPSGKYKLRVDAKTEKKEANESVSFTVR